MAMANPSALSLSSCRQFCDFNFRILHGMTHHRRFVFSFAVLSILVIFNHFLAYGESYRETFPRQTGQGSRCGEVSIVVCSKVKLVMKILWQPRSFCPQNSFVWSLEDNKGETFSSQENFAARAFLFMNIPRQPFSVEDCAKEFTFVLENFLPRNTFFSLLMFSITCCEKLCCSFSLYFFGTQSIFFFTLKNWTRLQSGMSDVS